MIGHGSDKKRMLKMAIILPTGQWYAPSAVINDAWYCIVLHGIAWYCMVLHYIALYCTILQYGIDPFFFLLFCLFVLVPNL